MVRIGFTDPILLVVWFVLTVYFLLVRKSRARKFIETIPGPYLIPFLGNVAHIYNLDIIMSEKLPRWIEDYGDRTRFVIGPKMFLALIHPDDVEKVLCAKSLMKKSHIYDTMIRPWLGDGLLISSGNKWHERRKLLTPAFHFQITESFIPIYNEQSRILVEILKEKSCTGETVEVHSMLSRCTLDIICETAMGKQLKCQRDLMHPYAMAADRQVRILSIRFKSPWLHPDVLFNWSPLGRKDKANRKILFDFVDQVIEERKAIISQRVKEQEETSLGVDGNCDDVFYHPKDKRAFLDLLLLSQLQDNASITDEDIKQETHTFMFEGHDTIASSVGWTLLLLGTHPEEQAKVHAEVDEIFRGAPSGNLNTSDIAKFQYLTCCIKESLRMYPSVSFMARKLDTDFILELLYGDSMLYGDSKHNYMSFDSNTVVPPGVDIAVSPYLTHRHPTFFPEPDEFRPSRFFPENAVGRHPFAYIPFSAGPRNCIGQKVAMEEEKVILAHILYNFHVEAVDPEKVIVIPDMVIRPKEGLWFKFRQRSH